MTRALAVFASLVLLSSALLLPTPGHDAAGPGQAPRPPRAASDVSRDLLAGSPRSVAELHAAETARIYAHLAAVERDLRSRGVSHLAAAQRAAREENLERLRAYRRRAVFPHNHDVPGERVPYFVDRHGTRCAMAFLIERSGRGDLVRRVASTRNNARVRELADDAEIVAWLEANSLTAAEAARIQPTYCGFDPHRPCDGGTPEEELDARDVALGTSAALLGTASVVWNGVPSLAQRGGAWPTALGLGSGVFGLAVGVPRIGDGGASSILGLADTGIGIAALATALLGPDGEDGSSAAETSPPRPARGSSSVSVRPLVLSGPGGARGVGLSLRF